MATRATGNNDRRKQFRVPAALPCVRQLLAIYSPQTLPSTTHSLGMEGLNDYSTPLSPLSLPIPEDVIELCATLYANGFSDTFISAP